MSGQPILSSPITGPPAARRPRPVDSASAARRRARRARFAAACLLLALAAGTGDRALADWYIVWSDEFDGASLDTNRWTAEIGNGDQGWDNGELEYYTGNTQNVYVADDLLHIVARQEATNGCPYTSARITTAGYTDGSDLPPAPGYFAKLYGRFEFRARLPAGVGCWPAFWLRPENKRNSPYGPWPASGEIDVMENDGAKPGSVQGTIHFGGNNTATGWYGFPGSDSVTNFHLYTIEWTTNRIQWSVDGHVSGTATNWWASSTHPFPAPFDTPFHIIMNLAVGGNFLGNPGTNTINASLPAEMLVDYVRVYDQVPPSPAISLTRSNGYIVLSWPTNIPCRLQALLTPIGGSTEKIWSDVPVASNPLIVTPTNSGALYRLISP